VRLISGAVALLLAVGVLAGCGDGPKPEAVARDYVATNAATKCDVLDPALVEQLTGKQGDAALAACRHNVTRVPAPTQVKVQGVKDEGTGEDPDAGGGVAEVRLVADGRPAEVRLRRQDGTWKIVGLGD
jgi:uncharacterized lipoprotein